MKETPSRVSVDKKRGSYREEKRVDSEQGEAPKVRRVRCETVEKAASRGDIRKCA